MKQGTDESGAEFMGRLEEVYRVYSGIPYDINADSAYQLGLKEAFIHGQPENVKNHIDKQWMVRATPMTHMTDTNTAR